MKRWLRLAWVTVAAMFLASVSSLARAETSPAWQGIWEGTIGTLPIRTCLVKNDYLGARGYYYYLSQRKIIALAERGDGPLWVEGGEANERATEPSWMFGAIGPALLTGQWRNKGRMLPIRLGRVRVAEGDVSCSSIAFNGHRITPTRIVKKPAIKDGIRYTRLIYNPGKQFDVEVETFALPVRSVAIRRVNALLHKVLPSGTGSNDYLDCEFSGLDGAGGGGNYGLTVAPVMITRNWLSTETSKGSYCGGAHPNAEIYPGTYDLRTGTKIDLLDWFGTQAVTHDVESGYESKPLTPAFRAFVIAQGPSADAECSETIAAADYWDAGLTWTGIAFSPSLPHVAQGCVDAIPVPFARLSRWLNAKGKVGVASVLADLSSR